MTGCPVKFSEATQLYCHEKCGAVWLDHFFGCQKSDADAFCKLKFCDKNAESLSFDTTRAWGQPGFSCDMKGFNFGEWFGIENVSYSKNLLLDFGHANENAVVSNVKCRVTAERGILLYLELKYEQAVNELSFPYSF